MIKLTKKQAIQYKQKWAAVRAVERDETRKLSFKQKLHQAASLMRWGTALNVNFNEDNENRVVRRRWARLKKNIP
ncbi:MAG: hypothetical protein HZC18_04270 [Candidatus Omnitrophica bacterium]|nr:hypothetical protein [Candidatus Omnitrophota bacterium]